VDIVKTGCDRVTRCFTLSQVEANSGTGAISDWPDKLQLVPYLRAF
jgi:hypothetical protein